MRSATRRSSIVIVRPRDSFPPNLRATWTFSLSLGWIASSFTLEYSSTKDLQTRGATIFELPLRYYHVVVSAWPVTRSTVARTILAGSSWNHTRRNTRGKLELATRRSSRIVRKRRLYTKMERSSAGHHLSETRFETTKGKPIFRRSKLPAKVNDKSGNERGSDRVSYDRFYLASIRIVRILSPRGP